MRIFFSNVSINLCSRCSGCCSGRVKWTGRKIMTCFLRSTASFLCINSLVFIIIFGNIFKIALNLGKIRFGMENKNNKKEVSTCRREWKFVTVRLTYAMYYSYPSKFIDLFRSLVLLTLGEDHVRWSSSLLWYSRVVRMWTNVLKWP